ncbi:MAG: WhiB family transcriptional regulator [Actinomycetota bacterium]
MSTQQVTRRVNLEIDWQNRAACRGPNQAIFFPPPQSERRSDKRRRERRAKEICAECPVVSECREYAIGVREQHGIWGGLTEVERRSAGGW